MWYAGIFLIHDTQKYIILQYNGHFTIDFVNDFIMIFMQRTRKIKQITRILQIN